jgi:hypothetical protein
MDGEEVCAGIIYPADDEVRADVALVSARLLARVAKKEEEDLPVEVLLEHRHGRHDLRLPPT